MSGGAYKLRFWGVRGSIPIPAEDRMRYGGNTSCLGLALSDTEYLVFDCGTGARELGDWVSAAADGAPKQIHILLTHHHLDHVEGLPFFAPLYDSRNRISIYGFGSDGLSTREILERLMSPPYFPIPLAKVPARLTYFEPSSQPLRFGDVGIRWISLNHPQGCVAYRLERAGRSIVYATDHEHGEASMDDLLVRFALDADYLIYDAQYVPSEYEASRQGWGHSTWYEGVRIATAARVKRLCLFHHHPLHTDDQIDRLVESARKEMPGVEVAREGMELPL